LMRLILRMLYKNLVFPKVVDRPFFYTSFVATADGKAYVSKKGYWPIGSRIDYDTFTFLRAHADAIIDGKQTAIRFGKNTIDTIHSEDFGKLRETLGKKEPTAYIVLTKHQNEELANALKNSYGFVPTISGDSIEQIASSLHQKGMRHVFIDGGPHVIASFLKAHLLDEIFLTLAPRIFGNEKNAAITMVEGMLLEPDEIKLDLLSMEQVENEVFLRYRVRH